MIRRFLSGSLAVALFIGVVAGPAAAAEPQWRIIPSPNVGDDENGFGDIARIPGTKRFWAVGSWTDIFEWTPDRTLIARWNGYAWTRIASPNVGDQDNELSAVSVRSGSNAWAVGSVEDPAAVPKTLIEHWDGHAWTVVPSPNEGGAADENHLWDVRAFSATDVWAVGDSTANGTLTMHRDAGGWSIVPAPDVAGRQCSLAAVTGVPGSSRRFAVGSCVDPATGDSRTLIERWNGTGWTIVPSPAPGVSSTLTDVVAVSGHELWAVGDSRASGLPGPTTGLTIRWNGHGWSEVASPSAPPPVGETHLLGASVVPGTSTLWAVGYTWAGSTGEYRVFSEFWDGTGWSIVPTAPGLPGVAEFFSAVAATGPTDVWGVGAWFDPDLERLFTLTEHYA